MVQYTILLEPVGSRGADTLSTGLPINATYRWDPVRPRPVTGEEPCGTPAFLTPLHSLFGPVVNRLLPASGGSNSCPRNAPILLELGSPVSDV